MSLPHALLGLISYRPSTGYELKTAFKLSVHFFWDATLPQIYRTLARMEEKGWLTSTVQHQDGKPSKKIYEITASGKEEFGRWLVEPAEIPLPRHPMLLKVFFGNRMPVAQLRDHAEVWRRYHALLLKNYEEQVEPIVGHYEAMSGLHDDARYWRFTLDYGKRWARMVVEWCDALLVATEEEPKKSAERGMKKSNKAGN